MIRGTTPTLEFLLPFDTKDVAEAFVTFAQNDAVVLDKRMTECECSRNKLTVRLSQEETLRLQCGCVTSIQIRVRTLNGEALASDIIHEQTDRVLKDGVI